MKGINFTSPGGGRTAGVLPDSDVGHLEEAESRKITINFLCPAYWEAIYG